MISVASATPTGSCRDLHRSWRAFAGGLQSRALRCRGEVLIPIQSVGIRRLCPLQNRSTMSEARHRTPLRGTPFWHEGMQFGTAIMEGFRDNSSMRQLQFFTTAELGRMRDRTASRNHSPEGDEFRRIHAHHRAWGLVQRHGRRLRHLRNNSCTPRPTLARENGRQDDVPAPARRVPPEQPQHSTPVAARTATEPARAQPARLTQSKVGAPPTRTGPMVPLPGPGARRPPAPGASPPATSHGSDRNAEVGYPTPRPPRHRHRQARKMVAGVAIHAHPNSKACRRSLPGRGPPMHAALKSPRSRRCPPRALIAKGIAVLAACRPDLHETLRCGQVVLPEAFHQVPQMRGCLASAERGSACAAGRGVGGTQRPCAAQGLRRGHRRPGRDGAGSAGVWAGERRRTGIEPARPGYRATPVLKTGRGTSHLNASADHPRPRPRRPHGGRRGPCESAMVTRHRIAADRVRARRRLCVQDSAR